MRKVYTYWIGLLIFFLTSSITLAEPGNPLSNSTNNFLGGIFHGQFTHDISECSAGTVAMDAGSRDFRASGTVGFKIDPDNRLKTIVEYLQQNIDYTFFTGASRQWVSQGALGLDFQHALNDRFEDYFTLNGYYSHAGSKNLSTIVQTFPSTFGTGITTDYRRIAGSNAGGVSPGLTVHLWQGSAIDVIINYDYVAYNNTLSRMIKANGLGATGNILQEFRIADINFLIRASAADRAPFNVYQLEGDWVCPTPTTALLLGVFGEHVQGKKTLPDTSIVGFNLTYQVDAPPAHPYRDRAQSFTSWMATPAVRVPSVLAVSDENVVTVTPGPPPTPSCLAPTAVGSFGTIDAIQFAPFSFSTAPFFNGNGQTLTYSATGLAAGVTIDPVTGVISSPSYPSVPPRPFTVTATSPCGSVTQSGVIDAG